MSLLDYKPCPRVDRYTKGSNAADLIISESPKSRRQFRDQRKRDVEGRERICQKFGFCVNLGASE
jgi:hypothetical protein